MISHDRKFVDNITTRTIEVTMGRIYDYKVNYSQYLQLRKERREQQQKAYDEQQKFIAETKEFIERFKGTYSKTLQVQSRVKMLEKLELLAKKHPDQITRKDAHNFTVPKRCVSVREPYSAERRKAASERAKAAGYQPPVRKSSS